MIQIDWTIISYINQFSRHSVSFDHAMLVLSNNGLRGCVLSMICWWVWFRYDEYHPNNREHIIATILSALVALPFARALVLALPFRLRPGDCVGFILPCGMHLWGLKAWSSFPSDHAVFYFTISTGLLFISRKIGAFALVYTTVFICFPRIYLGLHFPTDIIGGAIIGMSFGWLGNQHMVVKNISKPILSWERLRPSLFYPLLFLVTLQIANMFDSSRSIIKSIFTSWLNFRS